eukprot:1187639-Prorocentrum_minimum.AAC.3
MFSATAKSIVTALKTRRRTVALVIYVILTLWLWAGLGIKAFKVTRARRFEEVSSLSLGLVAVSEKT